MQIGNLLVFSEIEITFLKKLLKVMTDMTEALASQIGILNKAVQ